MTSSTRSPRCCPVSRRWSHRRELREALFPSGSQRGELRKRFGDFDEKAKGRDEAKVGRARVRRTRCCGPAPGRGDSTAHPTPAVHRATVRTAGRSPPGNYAAYPHGRSTGAKVLAGDVQIYGIITSPQWCHNETNRVLRRRSLPQATVVHAARREGGPRPPRQGKLKDLARTRRRWDRPSLERRHPDREPAFDSWTGVAPAASGHGGARRPTRAPSPPTARAAPVH